MRMQASDYQMAVEAGPPKPAPLIQAMRAASGGGAALLGPLELEALMLNMDASLRVHTRHQLFGWTQGMLQNLVRHELLICALRGAEPPSYQVDSFAGPSIEPAEIGELFRRDTVLVPRLVKAWEESRFHPVECDAGADSAFAGSALAEELKRVGAQRLIVHGTYDPCGRVASLF